MRVSVAEVVEQAVSGRIEEGAFEESLHPRTRMGEFLTKGSGPGSLTRKIAELPVGESHHLPGGVSVKRREKDWATVKDGTHLPHKTAGSAAKHASALSAQAIGSDPAAAPRSSYSHEPTGIGKTLHAHYDNAPKEAGVVGRRMIGESANQGGGKFAALYHLANGGRKHVGDFASHEDAHKAIVKAHERFAQSKRKVKESEENMALADVVEAAVVDVVEAADSLAKASSPEPFSTSKTSNWIARSGGLPPYIQHIAHDLMEKRGKTESNAIQMAIGIVRNWASGQGKVDANTRAAARKAVAEFEAKRAKTKAT